MSSSGLIFPTSLIYLWHIYEASTTSLQCARLGGYPSIHHYGKLNQTQLNGHTETKHRQDDKYPDRRNTGGMGSTEEQNKECYYLKRGRKISLLLLVSSPRCFHATFFFFLPLMSHRPQIIRAPLVDSQPHSQLEVIIFLPFLSGTSTLCIIFAKPSFTPSLLWPPSQHMTNGFLFIGTQGYCLMGQGCRVVFPGVLMPHASCDISRLRLRRRVLWLGKILSLKLTRLYGNKTSS